MTAVADIRPDHGVTDEVDEKIVISIRGALGDAGQDGAPLSGVMRKLIQAGLPVPSLGPAMTQLIREGKLDLTPDRRLRWVGEGQ